MFFLLALNTAAAVSRGTEFLGDNKAGYDVVSDKGSKEDVLGDMVNEVKSTRVRYGKADPDYYPHKLKGRNYIQKRHVIPSEEQGFSANAHGGDGHISHHINSHSKGLHKLYSGSASSTIGSVDGTGYTERTINAQNNTASSRSKRSKLKVPEKTQKPEIITNVVRDVEKSCSDGYEAHQDGCRKTFSTPAERSCARGSVRIGEKCVTRTPVIFTCPEGYYRSKQSKKASKISGLGDGDLCIKTAVELPKLDCPAGFEMDRQTWIRPTCKKEYSESVPVCKRGARYVDGQCLKVTFVGRECPDGYFIDGEYCIRSYQEACPKTKKTPNAKKSMGKSKKAASGLGTHRDEARDELFSRIVTYAKQSGSLGDHVDEIFSEPKARSMKQLESVIDQKNQFWDGVVHAEKAVREKGVSGSVSGSIGSVSGVETKGKIFVKRKDIGYVDGSMAEEELKKIVKLKNTIKQHKIDYQVSITKSAVCEWEEMIPAYIVVQEKAVPQKDELTMVLKTEEPDFLCEDGYELAHRTNKSRGKLCIREETAPVTGNCVGDQKGNYCIQEEELTYRCATDQKLVDQKCLRYAYEPTTYSWTMRYSCKGCDRFVKEELGFKDVKADKQAKGNRKNRKLIAKNTETKGISNDEL